MYPEDTTQFGEDPESLRESERDALQHEAKAEQSRKAWADAAHSPGETTIISPDESDENAAASVTAIGDEHVLVESIGRDEYAAYVVDTSDLYLIQFHDVVVAVADGDVENYRGPATIREVGADEAERILASAGVAF